MPNPTAGDIHVNKPLTNVSIAFLQEASHFVADTIFPNIPVEFKSDRYYTYDRGEFNRDEMAERADGTESAGAEYTVDNTPNYSCRVYALHKDIGDQARANSDSVVRLDTEATQYLTTKALIRREVNWASTFFTTSVWATDRTGVAAGPTGLQFLQWDDANSIPIEDVETEKTRVLQSTGFMCNVLCMGYEVYSKLRNHPDIVERIKFGQTPGRPAVVNEQTLAAVFDVDRIVVMKAIQNTAKEGLTAVHSFIGGKAALLVYAAPSPGLMTPSGGYTFSWTGYLGASPSGIRMKKFRMESRESDRVEIQQAFDQKLIANDCGSFYTSAVA